MDGPERFFQDLDALGLSHERMTTPDGQSFAVIRSFEVPSGRFQGQLIDLALPAVISYPQGVASCIHVRSSPHLFDLHDSAPSVRNIIPSALGDEWRYWSRAFAWSPDRTLLDLFAQINTVFHDA